MRSDLPLDVQLQHAAETLQMSDLTATFAKSQEEKFGTRSVLLGLLLYVAQASRWIGIDRATFLRTAEHFYDGPSMTDSDERPS